MFLEVVAEGVISKSVNGIIQGLTNGRVLLQCHMPKMELQLVIWNILNQSIF